jgi:hypothetical protein
MKRGCVYRVEVLSGSCEEEFRESCDFEYVLGFKNQVRAPGTEAIIAPSIAQSSAYPRFKSTRVLKFVVLQG